MTTTAYLYGVADLLPLPEPMPAEFLPRPWLVFVPIEDPFDDAYADYCERESAYMEDT